MAPSSLFLSKNDLCWDSVKTYNQELLAIIEVFKTWHHYLEGYKYKVFIFTDYNNLRQFIDTKSLSSRQVCWTQELSRYHFQTN